MDEEVIETTDDGEELPAKDQLKKLREKLKETIAEKQKYLENWQRDKAEFINARKRDEASKDEYLKFAEAKMVEEMLPILDSFNLALNHGENQEIKIIYQQFQKVLEKYDVTSFGKVGDLFDPNLHHSIGTVEKKDNEEHALAEVLQKGYMMKGRVIRPALVKIFS